jgi:hypothetical protein
MSNKISQKVFQKISQEKIQMKPKCYFTACSLAWLVGGVLAFLAATFIFIGLFFSFSLLKPMAFLRHHQLWGLFFSFHLLPWLLAAGLIYLAARFYRKSRGFCRHEEWMLLACLSGAALFLGIFLFMVGRGILKEEKLIKNSFFTKYWSLPQYGTFSGYINRVKGPEILEMHDWKGNVWEVDTSGCNCPCAFSRLNKKIRLVGRISTAERFEAWEGWCEESD